MTSGDSLPTGPNRPRALLWSFAAVSYIVLQLKKVGTELNAAEL